MRAFYIYMTKFIRTEKTQIYRLIDPNTLEIKYIGKSDISLVKRLVCHINQIYRKERFSDKGDWIENLIKQGKCPLIELIEEVDKNQAASKEKYWIQFYSKDYKLYNIMHNNNPDLFKSLHERCSIKIYEYTIGGEFIKEWESILEAANFYGLSSGNICSAANGKRKMAGKSMWRYFKTDKIPNYFKNRGVKGVHKYNKEGYYICSYDCARSIEGISFKDISKNCKGGSHTVKGFRYSYEKVTKLPPLKGLRIKQGRVKEPFKDCHINKFGKELYEKNLAGKTRRELMGEYNISYTTIDRAINKYKKKLVK